MRPFSWLLAALLALPCVVLAAGGPSRNQEVATIERETVKIRQLQPRHAVRAIFPSNQTFAQLLDTEVHRENPEGEVQISQRESVVLGLLRPGDNLNKILFQNLSDQVAGFYDYRNRTLYLRNNSGQVLGLERYDIAHEYTHALQDQHYGLARLLPDETPLKVRNSDAVSAHHALTEGDAVNTQTLFIYRYYTRQQIEGLVKLESKPLKARPLPLSIQREFDFPYTVGLDFVQTLYRRGGMAAVDAAYQRLPASTYEIMHPAAYLHHWRPVNVTLRGVRGFTGWRQVDDDVSGAFGYNLLLWQWLPRTQADRVTDGYRGDRYIFLERGWQNLMRMESVWQDAAAAGKARATFVRALRRRYPGARWKGVTLVARGQSIYLRASGARLTLAFAPNAELADRLGAAHTY